MATQFKLDMDVVIRFDCGDVLKIEKEGILWASDESELAEYADKISWATFDRVVTLGKAAKSLTFNSGESIAMWGIDGDYQNLFFKAKGVLIEEGAEGGDHVTLLWADWERLVDTIQSVRPKKAEAVAKKPAAKKRK